MQALRFFALTLLLAGTPALVQAQPDTKAGNDSAGTEKPMTREEAKAAFEKEVESYGWTRKGKGRLGSWAEISIPEGYRFTGKSGTKKLMEMSGNISSPSELGIIAPENLDWWVLFDFEDSGYVKDTDKDNLDADAILKQMRDGQEAANEARAERGLDKLFLDGWAMPPRYNDTTHNLEWAIKVRSEHGGTSINYLTKLLGRKGVMHVTLLIEPDQLEATLPTYQKLLTQFAYTSGQSYAEYRQGDRVAQYTLAGLITAGAGVAMVKSGWLAKFGILFAKLGKLAYVAVLAVLAGLQKLFVKLFGKSTPQN